MVSAAGLLGLLGAAFVGGLLAVAWALGTPVPCRVCGAPLVYRDWPARTCPPCRHRWQLAAYYGNLPAWERAVAAVWAAGLRGRAARAYIDGWLLASTQADDRRQRAA